jgi:hypothetical protein
LTVVTSVGRKVGTMSNDPIFDILRARVRSPETFHASRAEVEHLIEKLDRLLVHNAALSETVALQKVLMEVKKLSKGPTAEHFPVTGEP